MELSMEATQERADEKGKEVRIAMATIITTITTTIFRLVTVTTIYTSLVTALLLIIPAILLRLIPNLSSPSSPLLPKKSLIKNTTAITTTSIEASPQSSPSTPQTRSRTRMQQKQQQQQHLHQQKLPVRGATQSPLQSTLSFYLRCLIAIVALFISTSYGAIAALLLRLVGLQGLSQWTAGRCYKWLMWVCAGVSFQVVQGREYLEERPAVFMGNHQTELDVLLLGCIFPRFCSVTAKSSLKHIPFLGWFMTLSNTVFIDRTNRTTALAAFDSAASQMRAQRQSVFIFPEGTRSYAEHPSLLPFKKGGFHLAIKAQVPVVAIVCGCYSGDGGGGNGAGLVRFGCGNVTKGSNPDENGKGDKEGKSGGREKREKRFGTGIVPVSVLPPFPTEGLTAADVDGLLERVREAMLAELIRLSSEEGEQRKDW